MITPPTSATYVGRYAPSPTGELHLGNVRTALLAWLHARLHRGRFLMRMEDVDTPRVVVGSDSSLLNDLEWLGIDWDGDVVYQSSRTQLYRETLQTLKALNLTYPCFCSRKDIRQASSAPHAKQGVYPGICANLTAVQINELLRVKRPSVRLRVTGSLCDDCGDFILHRADGLFAYQLAVVVDDVEQGVTDVIRGVDLADSTARQRYLAGLIRQKPSHIRYHHAPLFNDESGQRMSKRDGSFSCQQWRKNGGTASALVAKLAHSVGLIDRPEPLSCDDLLAVTSLEALDDVFHESTADC